VIKSWARAAAAAIAAAIVRTAMRVSLGGAQRESENRGTTH
jgi:ATP-dependent Lon protease